MDKVGVIIAAGGVGKRFGSKIPKQYLELDNIPIIIRTILNFEQCHNVSSIIIAASSVWIDFLQKKIDQYSIQKVKKIIQGGKERLNSINNAINSVHLSDCDIILVHDAVRPFASNTLIDSIIDASQEYGAAIPGLNPNETIKSADEKSFVSNTLNRSRLWSIQTPQGFKKNILMKAYKHAIKNNIFGTDDASLVEAIGEKVKIIPGESENIKITAPFDITIANEILKNNRYD